MSDSTENESSQNEHQALSVIRMLWKRRWLALSIWIILSGVAIAASLLLPAVYKAEAVVLVDSQKIPEIFVSPTIKGDVPDRLALISQSVMTSTRLLGVIDDFHLYRDEKKRQTQEELLRRMREDISVSFEKNWTGDRMKAFRLGYQGRDATVVAEVTNRLAGLYVAENMRSREDQAQGTVDFFRQQLREAKKSLDEQEQRVARFKLEHNGALPEQETSLLATLNASSTELQGLQASIARAEENKLSLESALSAAESSEASLRAGFARAGLERGGSVQNGVVVRRSEVLLEQLRALRLRYTADHPDVQALERELMAARHAEAAAAQAQPAPAADDSKESINTPELIQQRERITTLRTQIEVAKHEIVSLQKQRDQVAAAVADCQARIGRLPLIEQEMTGLKRNYDESASNYNSLLQKQLAAGMATDMERSQQSERFTVVDPARTPQIPEKPKRLLIAILGSVGALAIGLLTGFGLEYRTRTLLGEWELPPGTVVLGRVPLMHVAAGRGPAAIAGLLCVTGASLLSILISSGGCL